MHHYFNVYVQVGKAYLIVRCPMTKLYTDVRAVSQKWKRHIREYNPRHVGCLDFRCNDIGPHNVKEELEKARPEVEHCDEIEQRDSDIEKMFEVWFVVGYAYENTPKRVRHEQTYDELRGCEV